MASVNKVILVGNLTRDPALRHTPKGTSVAEVGLACNRRYKVGEKMQEEVTYIDVTFWGSQAETLAKHLEKGSPLYVEGRLKLDQWDDKETGKKRSKLGVIGESFQFLGSKEGGAARERSAIAQPRPAKHPSTTGTALNFGHEADEGEDSIPF
jgi:single-strand DNA-binding protein